MYRVARGYHGEVIPNLSPSNFILGGLLKGVNFFGDINFLKSYCEVFSPAKRVIKDAISQYDFEKSNFENRMMFFPNKHIFLVWFSKKNLKKWIEKLQISFKQIFIIFSKCSERVNMHQNVCRMNCANDGVWNCQRSDFWFYHI